MKTRYLLYLLVVCAVTAGVLAGICAVLVHRQQNTLQRLRHPGDIPLTTDVYSRWTVLSATAPVTSASLGALLKQLHYDAAPSDALKPGQYVTHGDRWMIFLRNFQYPDQAYPAKEIKLEFSHDQLFRLQSMDGSELKEWRIEPERLAQWGVDNYSMRPQVRLEDLPPYVPGAILAMEDKRYYQHGALDTIGIARAIWVDIRHGHFSQGASTIGQQLARSIFLEVDRTLRRKILEAVLAVYLEFRYSKPQLLEMYLNQVYWGKDGGQTMLGIASASQSFFGKPASELTPGEAALLAGLLQSPNRFSPRHAPATAIERRDVVLKLMQNQNVISLSAYSTAVRSPLKLAPLADHGGEAAYFLATLQDELADRYSLPVLLSQGWRIFTTIDPVLQKAATRTLARQTGESVPQAALVAIDVADGAVRAWVGGTDYASSPFDRAVYAKRQPGSSFKPFVTVAALESRRYTTASFLDDAPLTVREGGVRWSPQNADRVYHGKVSLWDSLIHSWNVPMVRLAMDLGYPAVSDAARRAGLVSPLRDVPSLALGTSEVTVEELTSAYGTLASGGIRVEPYTIETIVTRDGQSLETHMPDPRTVIAPEITALVTQVLQDVLDNGTAKSVRHMDFPWHAAGKTGTAENYQDAWFVGYTPELVCGVWVGFDKPKPLGHAAAGIALPLWAKFMRTALTLNPPSEFVVPKTLIWKTIDTDSGLLALSGCIHRKSVAFLAGTEPTKTCPLHPGGILGFFKRWTTKPTDHPAVKKAD